MATMAQLVRGPFSEPLRDRINRPGRARLIQASGVIGAVMWRGQAGEVARQEGADTLMAGTTPGHGRRRTGGDVSPQSLPAGRLEVGLEAHHRVVVQSCGTQAATKRPAVLP
jgi:hypothetical protein